MKNSVNIDQQLQQLLQNSPLGLATFEATYRLFQVNPPFCELTAYSEQELNDLTLIDIIHPDDVDEMMALTRQLFNGEILSFTVQQRWMRKNGESCWVKLTISAISDESGLFSYGLVMVEDIAPYKQVADAYQRLREQMDENEQLVTLGRLTSTLAHEINNSMHVVQGLLNLSLEDLDNSADVMQYLNMSLTESGKVVELINRLRYSYRVEPEPAAAIELNQLLEEVAVLAHRELKRKNISVHPRLTPKLLSVTSRYSELYLIFLSLTLNLGEAMGSVGRGDIEIKSNILSEGVAVTLFGKNDEVQLEAAELDLSLSFSHDKIVKLGGDMSIDKQNGGIVCIVKIPFSIPETPPPV